MTPSPLQDSTRRRYRVAEPVITAEDREAVMRALESSWVSGYGASVPEFESAFSSYCGVAHGVATSSGTTALHLALAALDLRPGDEVIVPSFAIIVVYNAVVWAGGTPILVDSDARSWNLDVDRVEGALSPRTKAVVAVHTYGLPCDMAALRALCSPRGITLVEDAAEAHGATVAGVRAGALGDIACFSFFTNKAITTGEGGMVVTDAPALAERLRSLRDLGRAPGPAYVHERIGFNYRLSAMQAALGVSQLTRIEECVTRRRRTAGIYRERLAGRHGVTMRDEPPGVHGSDWMSAILLAEEARPDRLAGWLNERGVETRPFFHPIHRQAFVNWPGTLPVAEMLGQRGLLLPSGNGLRDDDVHYIASLIEEGLDSC